MASKVRVTAKSQKWTALGIIDAYLKMYPQATLEDLNMAFPRKEFAGADDGRGLLDTMANLKKHAATTATDFDDNRLVEWRNTNYFLTLRDGTEIAFTVSMWTKEMFDKIVSHAKLYDIEIAKYTAAEKGFGKRGEYSLEYLNGYVPPVVKKVIPAWLWALIGLLAVAVIGLILWLALGKKSEVVEVEVEKVVVVHDTLYIQQLEEIEKNYNAAQFTAGKADLNDDVKYVLHDLAKLMQKHPDLRLRLEGHTSAEGDAAFNQKLSVARAQAAVDFLVEHENVDPFRLEVAGYGSSRLKNPEDPMAPENRRTEFVVIE